MKRLSLILSLLILAAVALTACGGGSTQGTEVKVNGGSYWNITPAQLKEMLDNKDFPFINVHIPYEGEIADTDLFIPYNEIEQNLDKLPEDKDAKIVLYCRTDMMSNIAARTLVGSGYTNVWHLEGGFVEWERQGYQVIQKEQTAAESTQNGM